MKVQGYDWGAGNWPKCGKHGVSREEIEQVLSGDVFVKPVPARAEEARHIAVGTTASGRAVLIVFTWRERFGKALVRPISARFMHDKERRYHEEAARAANR